MSHILSAGWSFFIMISLSPLWVNAQTVDPGNRINVIVRARVSKDSTHRLSYSYSVYSLPTSQQTVQEFALVFNPANDSISQTTTAKGWEGAGITARMNGTVNLIIWWATIPNQTKPGDSATGLSYTTTQLPGICEYYAEGNHALPWFPEGMAEDSIPGYDDLTPYGPGIVGKTVGAVNTLSTIGDLALLDSLTSYTYQAGVIGWVKDQKTSDKYRQAFGIARMNLLRGKRMAALVALEDVLKNVDADSSSLITSETYALIRWNTEYLADKLKEMK